MAAGRSHIESLESVLSSFFSAITTDKKTQPESTPFLNAIINVYNRTISENIIQFALDNNATSKAINELKKNLGTSIPDGIKTINNPLTYLLDELICNIQQHACTDSGYIYSNYNEITDSVEIIIADLGISIYGSYVAAQKHLDKLGNSDAEALNLAQNGYSIKNLPDAENRGYGISSNIKMVVEGLHGEFAILSGNALMIHSASKKKIFTLPSEVDFKGTMVMVTIPTPLPADFNIYNYTS